MPLRSYPRPKRPTAKRWLWAVLVGSVLILGVYLWHPTTPIEHPPGVLVAAPPVQTSIDATPIQHGAYRLNTVATFEMDGRVLGTMRYSDDHARLAPWDLAIGWGPMSDSLHIVARGPRLPLAKRHRSTQYTRSHSAQHQHPHRPGQCRRGGPVASPPPWPCGAPLRSPRRCNPRRWQPMADLAFTHRCRLRCMRDPLAGNATHPNALSTPAAPFAHAKGAVYTDRIPWP